MKPEQYFKLRDDRELKSLGDLAKALASMSEDEFSHHVNHEKNDFRNWIKDVIQDHKLAEQIKNIKYKDALLHKIVERLNIQKRGEHMTGEVSRTDSKIQFAFL